MNIPPNHWQVQIHGSTSDLEHLARNFTSLPMRVTKGARDASFLYESAAFAACATSQEVLAVAGQEFAVLSGALKLVCESNEPLRSGSIYRLNAAGGTDVFVHIRETFQLRAQCGEVAVTETDSQGNVITRPTQPERTVLLAQLAASDAAVAKALRLHADEGSKSWVGLYRIYEVVEADVGGQSELAKRCWGSSSDQRSFKHSANSVAVAGDAARHGKEVAKPPKNPMSPDEAAEYVERLLTAWLASKGS